jgi:hypothetical protein
MSLLAEPRPRAYATSECTEISGAGSPAAMFRRHTIAALRRRQAFWLPFCPTSYVSLVNPIIALGLTTVFESYKRTLAALAASPWHSSAPSSRFEGDEMTCTLSVPRNAEPELEHVMLEASGHGRSVVL